MNPEVKEKWVAALRSGKYKQGQGELRSRHNRFCCLGVLCNTVNARRWRRPMSGLEGPWLYNHQAERDALSLPAGLSRDLDLPPDVTDYLAEWNDEGIGFDAIADWIEAEL